MAYYLRACRSFFRGILLALKYTRCVFNAQGNLDFFGKGGGKYLTATRFKFLSV